MKIRPLVPESEAIPQRLAALTTDETIRGIIFQSVERALSSAFGASAVSETMAAAGLAGHRFDAMSKFPLKDFLVLQQHAAKRLAPAVGGFDEAVARIGATAVETFFDSIAGKTMALLAGKDPTRLLTAVPNGYGLLVSYGRRTWRQVNANSGVFTFEEEYLGPVHNFGTFDTALRLVHGVDARFELDSHGPMSFAFRISW
jgi:uncharacterized protein (TIGR02265 family)